jgi:hypothetical protein
MAKSKSRSGSSDDSNTPPAPLFNNYMDFTSGTPARTSLFETRSEKVLDYYFFLPGNAKLYTTPTVKMNDNEQMITTWPIDDMASQSIRKNSNKSVAALTDASTDSKGIPVGNFFQDEKSAILAAAKAYSRIPVCIIKLSIPAKTIGKITEIPNKKERKIFSNDLMPYVQSVSEFSPKDKFQHGIAYKKTGSGTKTAFESEINQNHVFSPRLK